MIKIGVKSLEKSFYKKSEIFLKNVLTFVCPSVIIIYVVTEWHTRYARVAESADAHV